MARAERFELITTPESEAAADRIADILTENRRKRGARGKVSKSDAIRWAIMFADKHLTEIINPEDLSDD